MFHNNTCKCFLLKGLNFVILPFVGNVGSGSIDGRRVVAVAVGQLLIQHVQLSVATSKPPPVFLFFFIFIKHLFSPPFCYSLLCDKLMHGNTFRIFNV
jgi:hypothetical protein